MENKKFFRNEMRKKKTRKIKEFSESKKQEIVNVYE